MGEPGHSRRCGQLNRAPACPISDHQTAHTVGYGWSRAGHEFEPSCPQAVRARGAAGEQSAHGAESPGMHCLVAAAACAENAGAEPRQPVHAPPARGRC
eukprot:504788-Prymnesium_polylepis.1